MNEGDVRIVVQNNAYAVRSRTHISKTGHVYKRRRVVARDNIALRRVAPQQTPKRDPLFEKMWQRLFRERA